MNDKFYKWEDGRPGVYAFALDGSQDHAIKKGMVPMTTEEVEAHLNPPPGPPTLESVHDMRRRAYSIESDPIKNEADYDALVNGTAPDYTAWVAAVEAIKARYPLPVEP